MAKEQLQQHGVTETRNLQNLVLTVKRLLHQWAAENWHKMLIFVAENGRALEVDCQSTTTVESVQNALLSLTNIAPSDQMLICGEMRLESNRPLGSYKLPAENRNVFLYNRSRLVGDTFPPLQETDQLEINVPKILSSSKAKHPLDDALDPALKALPSYENEFQLHFHKGHALFNASQRRLEVCGRLLQEMRVQEMALETARGNMDLYYKNIDGSFTDFMKQYLRQHKRHAYLLSNLENDLERLRACTLHPALRSETRQSLINFVNVARVRRAAEECGNSHEQFGGKVLELKSMYSELQRMVRELFYARPPVDLQGLEETLDGHVRLAEEQASIIQSLSQDVSTVKKLVDNAVKENQNSNPIRPHDAVSGLGPMYEVHEKIQLPRMETCDWELRNLQEYSTKSKIAMNVFVHTQLQMVALLQSNIRDMRNRLAVFKEAILRQDELFKELKSVRKLASAYKACLAEVIRRKAGAKLYMGQAGQLAEKLAGQRELEVAQREEFLRVQSAFIPPNLMQEMGLYDMPSQCVVNIAPFDANLLNIDVEDLGVYAPESLFGPLFLSSGQSMRTPGDSATTSGLIQGVDERPLESQEENHFHDIEDPRGDEDVTRTSNLEVDNAWLKSELAAAVAMLCNLDPDFELDDEEEETNDGDSERLPGIKLTAVRKTAEALRLKDDHARHLHDIIAAREAQCTSYEGRIQELEQRLENHHMEQQRATPISENKLNTSESVGRSEQMLDESITSETSDPPGVNKLPLSVGVSETMDEGIISAIATECSVTGVALDTGVASVEKIWEGSLETSVTEPSSRLEMTPGENAPDEIPKIKDGPSAMAESKQLEPPSGSGQHTQLYTSPAAVSTEHPEFANMTGSIEKAYDNEGQDLRVKHSIGEAQDFTKEDSPPNKMATFFKVAQERVRVLQSALVNKTHECESVGERLTTAMEEIEHLRADLERNVELLTEAQLNCAHLENRLHEAREEARTNFCAANRRAAEYNALRTSSVRLRGLMERLKSSIAGPPSSFIESLRALAVSLSSVGDDGEDGEFRKAIRVLADRVGILAQQRVELLERCKRAESNQLFLSKELERLKL